MSQSSAIALDGTLCLVDQDRVRPIIVDDLSKWETVDLVSKFITNWFTLRYENKEYVLDEQIPTINGNSNQEEIEAHQKHYDDANKVSCIMASFMSPKLQNTFENT
ncbi:hypothetical protein Tco_1383425 [Tanacetum coccineum]